MPAHLSIPEGEYPCLVRMKKAVYKMENLFYWTRPHGTPESLSLRWRGATANDFLLTLSRV